MKTDFLFCMNLIALSDPTPIVIYGLGKQTEEILTECDDDRIIGVLDGFREEGIFCGKPILSLKDLAGRSAKIIIVARAASEKIIYRRIKDFCLANHIKVYNLAGEDLSLQKAVVNHPYYSRSAEELIEKAVSYDAVSFDIFDTLLTRKIPNRELFYDLIAKEGKATFPYAKLRLSVEMELSKGKSPKLVEIYNQMKEENGVPAEEADRLMRMELEFEEKNLLPREEMVNIFHQLMKNGVRSHLVSDMYFTKEYIEKILRKYGITGYGELLVSCEYGTTKTGGLFDEYKKLVPANRYLHIGDSEEADGIAAEEHGIDSYLIKSATDMAELTEMGQALLNQEHTELLLGLLSARAFNSPFALFQSSGHVCIKEPYALGYALLGPVMAGFTHWLIQKVREMNLEKLLFISRDGYLPKKVYEMFTGKQGDNGLLAHGGDDLPEAIYLYTSRMLDVVASIQSGKDVVWAAKFPFAGTDQDMLVKRFGLSKEQLLPRRASEDDGAYILRHAPLIIEYASKLRANYQKYLNSFELKAEKTGIFDFVSTGTCHLGLERILGFGLKGLYFERLQDSDAGKQVLDIRAYVREIMPELDIDNYFLLENWIKATHPSVRSVSASGEIVFSENRISEEQVEKITRIQDGAIDFCRDLLAIERHGIKIDIQKAALTILPFISTNWQQENGMVWVTFDEFTNRRIGE